MTDEKPKGWKPDWNKKWDAHNYAGAAGDIYGLAGPLFAALEELPPKKGAKILDLGAGEGRITRLLIESRQFKGYGFDVTAVDYSADMVAKAVERGINAHQMDASRLTFDGEFDVVFSLSALHWVENAEGVVAGVAKALKPGGAFIAEFARHSPPTVTKAILEVMREEGYDVAVFNPWRKTTVDEYKGLLDKYGLGGDDLNLAPVNRHVHIPWGMKKWLEAFIKDSFLSPLDGDEEKDRVMDKIVERLKKTHLYDEEHDQWYVDYQRLSVRAIKVKEIVKAPQQASEAVQSPKVLGGIGVITDTGKNYKPSEFGIVDSAKGPEGGIGKS